MTKLVYVPVRENRFVPSVPNKEATEQSLRQLGAWVNGMEIAIDSLADGPGEPYPRAESTRSLKIESPTQANLETRQTPVTLIKFQLA